jgi:hypothetical protein
MQNMYNYSIKYCWASSRVRWLNGEEPTFQGPTISVLVIRELTDSEIHPCHNIPARYISWQEKRVGKQDRVEQVYELHIWYLKVFLNS